jgi:glutamyl-tRNA synthetase
MLVRTRFAPSPTGYVHVGNLRSALYAYLFARHNNGEFIFRLEDTDKTREVEGSAENLMQTLEWAGMSWDEGPIYESTSGHKHGGGDKGPYIQSQRTGIYETHIAELMSKGHAYKCFCTAERLEEMRRHQEAGKLPPKYDGNCRSLTDEEAEQKMSDGIPCVVRLKVPHDELIIFSDIVRGKVKIATKEIDDQVLLKSDGLPTYHLANVVDDHLMEITHVIRGEEWLPSTPKHILLYRAFDWEPPEFAHLPLLLNEDRSKLSKRQGDVAVEDYIEKGYSKEALINFIAFMGWNPGGTKEIYSMEELIREFDISNVQKAGAIFNLEKLNWYSWVWKQRFLKEFAESKNLDMKVEETKRGYKIDVRNDKDRHLFSEKLIEFCRDYIQEEHERDEHFLYRALYANKDKILQEPEKVEEYIRCYFEDIDYIKDLLINERMNVDEATAKSALQSSIKALQRINVWSEQNIKNTLVSTVEALQLKNGQVLWPVRAALTGVEFSPGAFESAWVLGKEQCLSRLQAGLSKLS